MTFSSRASSPGLYIRVSVVGTCLGALLLAAACGSSDDTSGETASGTDGGDGGSSESRDATSHDAADAAKKDGSSATDAAKGDAAGEAGTTSTPDSGTATVHFNGRMDMRDSAGPRFDWSGSSVTASFTGTGIAMRMGNNDTGNGPNRMQVVIDGTPDEDELELTDGTDVTYVLASGLAAGTHTVEVYKRTEGYYGAVQFLGFQAEDDSDTGWAIAPSTAPSRHLEIIGDSISAGYGVLSPSVTCKGAQYLDYQDAYLAYGLDTARELSATAVSIAQSGKGVYRDNTGSTTHQLPYLYPLTLASDTVDYDFAQPIDAVVINLGTNDFAESYSGEYQFKENFETAYLGLVTTVRSHYPDAYILMIAGPMLNNYYPFTNAITDLKEYLDDIVATRQQAGDTQIGDLEVGLQNCGTGTGQEACGCDDHPNVARQQTMADSIAAALRTAKGW